MTARQRRCHRCREPGHASGDCPNGFVPNVAPARDPALCYRCGERGHKTAECPQPPARHCSFCGREGHYAPSCHERRARAAAAEEGAREPASYRDLKPANVPQPAPRAPAPAARARVEAPDPSAVVCGLCCEAATVYRSCARGCALKIARCDRCVAAGGLEGLRALRREAEEHARGCAYERPPVFPRAMPVRPSVEDRLGALVALMEELLERTEPAA